MRASGRRYLYQRASTSGSNEVEQMMFLDESQPLAPVAPALSPAPWRGLLISAARAIEKYGWCQDSYFEGDIFGPRCMVGAIAGPDGWDMKFDEMTPSVQAAIAKVAENISPYLIQCTGETLEYAVTGWNDDESRTKEDVIAKLREVAGGPG
jgi:hypothetical protein